jgi:ribosomal protein S27AE
MELAKFDEKSICPKCGHGEIGTRYCKGTLSVSLTPCRSEMKASFEEHMDRTCERCGYVWAQAVLE